MINAKELRIGNRVLSTFDLNDKTEITLNEQTFLLVLKYGGNEFYPIPLTPEILKKCGISKYTVNVSPMDELADKPVYYTEIFLTVNAIDFYIKKKDQSHAIYLHTLQNLYFTLTDEELEILM